MNELKESYAEIERLKAERDEARADVERLKAENERLRVENGAFESCNRARLAAEVAL